MHRAGILACGLGRRAAVALRMIKAARGIIGSQVFFRIGAESRDAVL
jgi:hypothetical protein